VWDKQENNHMISDKSAKALRGRRAVGVILALLLLEGGLLTYAAINNIIWLSPILVLLIVLTLASCAGFLVINPNQAAVAQLFGEYVGTIKQDGFWWMNPFYIKHRISLRIRNFESGKLKVNDRDGNPIEIAAVVVWKIVDSAEALFNVDDYENFVRVQSESALRNMATSYPYDSHIEHELSLRGSTAEVAEKLKGEIQDRFSKAGVEVIEARVSHLAYAPEIASAMLRRQQANAIIAARARIVEGAVSMVQMALEKLEQGKIVKLDEERKASMVSNLLVVLTSDRDAQPVVNTGTLYQ
jgi:regulator of protease activity HflC (stomatin/prohibitin superfamily)